MPITRPPNVVPGIGRLTEPLAMMMPLVASYSVPSLAEPTRTMPPPAVIAPWPSMTSILFFLKRPLTPPLMVFVTLSRRAWTLPKSTECPDTSMPNSPASSISLRMSAERSTTLAGMQA